MTGGVLSAKGSVISGLCSIHQFRAVKGIPLGVDRPKSYAKKNDFVLPDVEAETTTVPTNHALDVKSPYSAAEDVVAEPISEVVAPSVQKVAAPVTVKKNASVSAEAFDFIMKNMDTVEMLVEAYQKKNRLEKELSEAESNYQTLREMFCSDIAVESLPSANQVETTVVQKVVETKKDEQEGQEEVIHIDSSHTLGKRAVFVSNRIDPDIVGRLKSTFKFSKLETYDVNKPSTINAVAVSIKNNNYDYILYAGGFMSQSHVNQLREAAKKTKRSCKMVDIRKGRIHAILRAMAKIA